MKIDYWTWTWWILVVLSSFAVLEGWAIATGSLTLSRYIANLSQDWPMLPWVMGVVVGGLAVHFWWYWHP